MILNAVPVDGIQFARRFGPSLVGTQEFMMSKHPRIFVEAVNTDDWPRIVVAIVMPEGFVREEQKARRLFTRFGVNLHPESALIIAAEIIEAATSLLTDEKRSQWQSVSYHIDDVIRKTDTRQVDPR